MQPDVVMILFPFLFLFVAPCCLCQLKQCYNPYGVTFPDFPCDPGADVSACCGVGSTCETNFYCETGNPQGGKAVGSCTDKTWQNPACPLNINIPLDIGTPFNFTLNTTACADGTFCPNPDNQTCCFNHQGHTLTSYHYDTALPTAAAALSTIYAENGYQIATITSSSSNVLPTTSPSSPLPGSPSTSVSTSSYVGTSLPDRKSPSPLSMGTKTGIGLGTVFGTLSIAGIFLLLRRVRRHRRDSTKHSRALGATEMAPLDQRRWEKPELIGEDARKEMEAEERRRPELPGEGARAEMGAADLRHMIVSELPSQV